VTSVVGSDQEVQAMRLANITFDCDDVLVVATFWSAVLGRPLDEGADEGFASIGVADGERAEPAWYFNKVPEPKRAKNRVHVDLTADGPGAVDELVDLGAIVVGEQAIPGHRWMVMRDPGGNEFCVAQKGWTGFS
jgi:predicted enzyme related to lactoylglutathione lyase